MSTFVYQVNRLVPRSREVSVTPQVSYPFIEFVLTFRRQYKLFPCHSSYHRRYLTSLTLSDLDGTVPSSTVTSVVSLFTSVRCLTPRQRSLQDTRGPVSDFLLSWELKSQFTRLIKIRIYLSYIYMYIYVDMGIKILFTLV